MILAPFAWLPLPLAGAVFMGLSAGLAAWGIARTGAERLPLFLSAPFLMALSLGQWSPLLVAAALIPAVGAIVCAKPNIGLPVFVARPSWQAVLGALLLVAISLAVMPRWPLEWLANVTNRQEKFIPLLRPGGFLLLAALLGWRRPEGRLLAVMSVVPQALFFYDQLLLGLVPRTLRQSLLLSLWGGAVFLAWWRVVARGDINYVQQAVPYAYSLYFPALAILLWNWWQERRRNSEARAGSGGVTVEMHVPSGTPLRRSHAHRSRRAMLRSATGCHVSIAVTMAEPIGRGGVDGATRDERAQTPSIAGANHQKPE